MTVNLHLTGTVYLSVNNNNLLLGGSITKSGLHRGPNIRYILSKISKIHESILKLWCQMHSRNL